MTESKTILHELLRDFPGMADALIMIMKSKGKLHALEALEEQFSQGSKEEIAMRIEEEREGILAWAIRGIGGEPF